MASVPISSPPDHLHTVMLAVDPASFAYDYQDTTQPNGHSQLRAVKSSTYTHDHVIINRAARLVSTGHVVGFPTETVYGLAANALDPCAVSKIFIAKNRPPDNPLIVHISSLAMLYTHILPPGTKLPSSYEKAIEAHWPGPLTILLPKSPAIPNEVVANQPTVGVRFPSHPVARALIEACGFPVAAPSANTSGRPSPTLACHVFADLDGRIPLVIDGGPCLSGVESTVLDGLSCPPAILRPGGVTYEELRGLKGMEGLRVHGRDFRDEMLESAPTTPGMKYRHYTPDCQVVLIEHSEDMDEKMSSVISSLRNMLQTIGILRTRNHVIQKPRVDIEEYHLGSTPNQVAHQLFKGLRELESRGVSVILVEGISDTDEGLAVMNRVRKAASRIIA
ncbi:hypothetical protein SeLEV6574_g01458 [Synchytrium endobioticum]|uniref:Threonylcarbamoyl-AMP synthase n=1 Tax=Synchytrium endobioticum TaxID=286115 RepID=A0A507DCV9_9FUNG|nr:hypothetical protein SeLEV6574_g01458 [Synchytrium endobioticum]